MAFPVNEFDYSFMLRAFAGYRNSSPTTGSISEWRL